MSGTLEDRINIVTQSAPTLSKNPNILVALANSSLDDNQLYDVSRNSEGIYVVSQGVKDLQGKSQEDQVNFWNTADANTQNLYQTAGYQPPADLTPPAPAHKGGLWNYVEGIVNPLPPLQRGVSTVLQAANWGTQQVKHLALAADYGIREPGYSTRGPNDAPRAGFFHPSEILPDFKYLWDKTKNGESTFIPKDLANFNTNHPDGLQQDFGRYAAGQMRNVWTSENVDWTNTAASYLQKNGVQPNTPQFNDQFQKLHALSQDKEFTTSVLKLAEAKMSIGRDLARGVSLDPGSVPYAVVSGGTDAFFDVKTDPTLILGNARHDMQAAKFAVDLTDAENSINKIQDLAQRATSGTLAEKMRYAPYAGVQVAAEKIAQGFSTGDLDTLQKTMPQWTRSIKALQTYNDTVKPITEASDVYDFLRSQGGIAALGSGQFAGASAVARTVVPRLTPLQVSTAPLKLAAERTFEFMANPELRSAQVLGQQMHAALVEAGNSEADATKMVTDTLPELTQQIKGNESTLQRLAYAPVRGLGQFMYGATHYIPASGQLRLDAPDTLERFRQVLNAALPNSDLAKPFFNDFAAASPANRRFVYRAALEAGAAHAGLFDIADGRQKFDEWVNGLLHRYSPGDEDVMHVGGQDLHIGMDPEEISNAVHIPAYRDVAGIAKQVGVQKSLYGTVNSELVDGFMSRYWKPAMLLRVGFIPRVAMEETLTAALRYPGYLKNTLLHYLADSPLDQPIAAVRPFLWASRSIDSLVPDSLHGLTEPLDRWNAALWGGVSRSVRTLARPLADPEYARAISEFSSNLGLGQAVMSHDTYQALSGLDDMKRYTIPVRQPGGDIADVELGAKGSDFERIAKDDPWYLGRLVGKMKTMAESRGDWPLILDAMSRHLTTEEANGIMEQASQKGLAPVMDPLALRSRYMPAEPVPVLEKWLRGDGTNPDEVWKALRDGLPGTVGDDEITKFRDLVGDMPIHQRVGLFTRDGQLEQYARRSALDNALQTGNHMYFQGARAPWEGDHIYTLQEMLDSGLGSSRLGPGPGFYASTRPGTADAYALQGIPENPTRYRIAWTKSDLNQQGRIIPPRLIDPKAPPDELLEELHKAVTDLVSDQGIRTALWNKAGEMGQAQSHGLRSYENLYHNVSQLLTEWNNSGVIQGITGDDIIQRLGQVNKNLMQKGWDGIIDSLGESPDLGGTSINFWRTEHLQRVDEKSLPELALRERTSGTEQSNYSQLLRELYGGDPDLAERHLKDILTSHKMSPGFADVVDRAERGQQTADGRVLAKPIPNGSKRVYTVAVPASSRQAYTDFLLDHDQVPGEDGAAFLALSHDDIYKLAGRDHYMGPASSHFIEGVPPGRGITEGPHITRNGQGWFTTDYDKARQMLEVAENKLSDPYRGPHLADPGVKLGFVDVDAQTYNKGRQAAMHANYGGLHPLADTTQFPEVFLPPEVKAHLSILDNDRQMLDKAGNVIADYQEKADQLNTLRELKSQYSNLDPAGEAAYARLTQELDGATAVNGVDLHTVIHDWSDKTLARAHGYFHNPDAMRSAFRSALDGHLSLDDLDKVELGDLPKTIIGPKLVIPKGDTLPQRIVRFGFDNVIGPFHDALVRKPLFIHLYAQALKDVGPGLRQTLMDPTIWKSQEQLAAKYGMTSDSMLARWHALPNEAQNAADPAARLAQIDPTNNMFESWDRKDLSRLRQIVGQNQYVEKTVRDVAHQNAIGAMAPFIIDHNLRSQFQEHARNLFPFWFAQEQFVKRWARTLAYAPEALEKAQLAVQGLRHVGILTKNEYGEDVFNVPGSSALTQALTHGLQAMTGKPYVLPIPAPMTGQLQYTTPGFDRTGMPGVGPLVGVPLTMLRRRFPELESTEQALLGPRGADRSLPDQLLPTSIMRFYHAIVATPNSDQQMASAMISAMQYAEANGLAPADDASAHDRQVYIDRVKNWSRAILLTRGIVGFMSPASPTEDIPSLRPDFTKLLKNMPIEDAVQQFMKDHPDGNAWTVLSTKSVSGAPLPATDAAYKTLQSHSDYFNRYQAAGPWLLPQSNSTDKFSRDAYNEQLAQGLRVRKTPEQWYEDMKFSAAAGDYFTARDQKDGALKATTDQTTKQAISTAWDQWKSAYFAMHPIFAERLQSPDGHIRRDRAITELQQALADPNRPSIPQAAGLGQFVNMYQQYQTVKNQLAQSNTNQANLTKKVARDSFIDWADQFSANDPRVKAFWNFMRPEVGGV